MTVNYSFFLRFAKPLLILMLIATSSFESSSLFAEEALTNYEIQSGDNLWKLCKKFKQQPTTCWSELAKINNIKTPDTLKPNKIIKLPYSWLGAPLAEAKIIEISGLVQLFSFNSSTASISETPIELTGDYTLSQGDLIKTGENSRALIVFEDKTEMRIHENSELELDVLTHDKALKKSQTKILLNKGKVSSLVNPEKQQTEFEIKTPFAVAAVRGTMFRVSADGEVSSSEVLEGNVDVNASGKTVGLAGGFASIIEKGKAPSGPIKLLDPPSIKPIQDLKKVSSTKIKWAGLKNAESYEVDLFKLSENRYELMNSQKLSNNHFVTEILNEGDYKVSVRGVDEQKLVGLNANETFQVVNVVLEEKPCSFLQRKQLAQHCR